MTDVSVRPAWASPPSTRPGDQARMRRPSRSSRAAAGATEPLSRLWPALRDRGVKGVSANGVLGDPRGATPEEGHRILDHWAAGLTRDLDGWP